MCFKLFHLHDTALRSNIWCFPQINLGISDFRMLMMVINDNLLEGRGGELWPIFLLYIEHSIKTLSTFTACWYIRWPFYTVRPLLCRTPRGSQIFWTVAARWRSQVDNSGLVKRASGFSVKIVPFEQCSNYPHALLYAFGSMSSYCKLVLRNKLLAFGQGHKPRKSDIPTANISTKFWSTIWKSNYVEKSGTSGCFNPTLMFLPRIW